MAKTTNRSEKDRNEFTSWLYFYLRMAGLWPGIALLDKPRVCYHVSAMGLACVGGWILFSQKYDDFSINTDVLLHAVLVGHSLLLYLVYLRQRKTLWRIVETMEDRFSQFSKSLYLDRYTMIWDRSDRLSLILMRFGSYSCVVLYTVYIFHANIFSAHRKLIYPLWVPYSTHSSVNYYFTVILQLTIISLYSFIHVSGCGICIGGSHFIGASFDVLGNVFQDLCKIRVGSHFEKGDNISKKTYEAFLLNKLKLCVDAHVEILRLTKDYKSVFELILLEVLLSCQIIICFAGFQLLLAAEMRDHKKVMMLMVMVLVLVFHLFMFCYPGQHIYNKSEQFRERLYTSRWEDKNIQFQKCLSFMLLETLRPVTVSCHGITNASMASFQHVTGGILELWALFCIKIKAK